jgi:hypothetical protein
MILTARVDRALTREELLELKDDAKALEDGLQKIADILCKTMGSSSVKIEVSLIPIIAYGKIELDKNKIVIFAAQEVGDTFIGQESVEAVDTLIHELAHYFSKNTEHDAKWKQYYNALWNIFEGMA